MSASFFSKNINIDHIKEQSGNFFRCGLDIVTEFLAKRRDDRGMPIPHASCAAAHIGGDRIVIPNEAQRSEGNSTRLNGITPKLFEAKEILQQSGKNFFCKFAGSLQTEKKQWL